MMPAGPRQPDRKIEHSAVQRLFGDDCRAVIAGNDAKFRPLRQQLFTPANEIKAFLNDELARDNPVGLAAHRLHRRHFAHDIGLQGRKFGQNLPCPIGQLAPFLGETVHRQLEFGRAARQVGGLGPSRLDDLVDIPVTGECRSMLLGIGSANRTDFPIFKREESSRLDNGGEPVLIRAVVLRRSRPFTR